MDAIFPTAFAHFHVSVSNFGNSHNISNLCTGEPKYLCGSLYYDIRFIAVVWTGTHSISEVPVVLLAL